MNETLPLTMICDPHILLFVEPFGKLYTRFKVSVAFDNFIYMVVVLCLLLFHLLPTYKSSKSVPGVQSGVIHGLVERLWLVYAFASYCEDLHLVESN